MSTNNNNNNNNSNKKAKKDESKKEIESLQQFLQENTNTIPGVPPSSVAIQICLNALQQEWKKIERDERLQWKFAQEQQKSSSFGGGGGGRSGSSSTRTQAGSSLPGSISSSLLKSENEESMMAAEEAQEDVDVDVDDDVDDDVVCIDMESILEKPASRGSGTNRTNHHHPDSSSYTMMDSEWQDIQKAPTNDDDHDDIMNQPSSTSPTTTTTTTTPHNGGGGGNSVHQDASTLGKILAQTAIVDMTAAEITISTPTAALALALHSALRSSVLGFKCTGIVPDGESCFQSSSTEKQKKKQNGFAPPVRELPKGTFLPDDWDALASRSRRAKDDDENELDCVQLRYRKSGIGATILRVISLSSDPTTPSSSSKHITATTTNTSHPSTTTTTSTTIPMVEISFGPAGGEPWTMTIPMSRHINVDGFHAALEKSNYVQPALHYKALPLLLSEFCNCADLGIVKEEGLLEEEEEQQQQQQQQQQQSDEKNIAEEGVHLVDVTMANIQVGQNPSSNSEFDYGGKRRPPTLENDLLGNARIVGGRVGGDFAGDLLPSGIPAPGVANPMPNGNLMGMNHPYFQGVGLGDEDEDEDDPLGVGGTFPQVGGLGMQPRFDPYYPPGVSGCGGGGGGGGRFGRGGRGRGRRGGRGRGDFSGDPNPDHQRPPNTFGGNMFM